MGLRISDTYAKLWNIDMKEKYSVVELSVSRKNKDGKYETDFSYKFVRFVGTAHQKLQGMTGDERIKILSGDISNHYDKEKNTTYTNYVVFDFEVMSQKQQNPTTNNNSSQEFMNIPDNEDNEIPFN